MITTTLSAGCITKSQVIALGRQMENNYRQIVFDLTGFTEPITDITLVHQRSKDAAPYIVESTTGDTLTWTISNTDTAFYGYGKAELRISFADGLAKSITFTTLTVKSITADTTIPAPLQSWYDAMIEYIDEHSVTLDEVDQLVEEYLEEHPVVAPVQSVNSMTGDVVITAASLGALTSESDPVFGASAAAGITAADITAWNGKYTKPSSGIPATDLTSTVQSRLLKTGGSTGQVLAKVSGTNYDVAWTTVSGGGAVDSVNGQTGTVVLDADDVGALPDTYTAPVTSVNTKTGAVTLTASDVGALSSSTTFVSSFNGFSGAVTYTAPVSSVNTKTGAVSLSASDVGALPDTYTAPVSSVDGKTGTVTVIPTGGSTGQVLAKASNTDRDVEWVNQSGGGGGETVTYANVQLATGTKEAGWLNTDSQWIDTGLTLADLRRYKYWYVKIRLDDGNKYLGLKLHNTTVQIGQSNAIAVEFQWVDTAKTGIMPISVGFGNAGLAGTPSSVSTGNSMFARIDSMSDWIGGMQIENASDTSKVYIGISHWNGQTSTSKDFLWGIYGLGAYE